MWQIHAQMALDLARERAEEARQQLAGGTGPPACSARGAAPRAAPLAPAACGWRSAATLRAASGLFGSISDAACDAAARLDHRTA